MKKILLIIGIILSSFICEASSDTLHIRQKNSSKGENKTYTVVKTTGWEGDLKDHPSIKENPELFEISDDEIPKDAEYLNYTEEL